jgi:dihydroorotate dehydrogenase
MRGNELRDQVKEDARVVDGWYTWAKTALFSLDAEQAHDMTMHVLRAVCGMPSVVQAWEKRTHRQWEAERALLQTHVCGIAWEHPLGLAAGLDKNARCLPAWRAMGFACTEIGTVTPLPQIGNDKPRLVRVVDQQALINRMGFNNAGAREVARTLFVTPKHPRKPVFINIGKNKATPNEEATNDYVLALRALYALGDAFVINVSSPNTPGLRDLQQAHTIRALLEAIIEERELQHAALGIDAPQKPLLVKISPDLTDHDLADTIDAIRSVAIDGIVATNTTNARDPGSALEAGGLSGAPLRERSRAVIRDVYQATRGMCPIVGCGGISDADDAYAAIQAGACALQLYTALIYQGPSVVSRIVCGLAERLRADGCTSVRQAIGVAAM